MFKGFLSPSKRSKTRGGEGSSATHLPEISTNIPESPVQCYRTLTSGVRNRDSGCPDDSFTAFEPSLEAVQEGTEGGAAEAGTNTAGAVQPEPAVKPEVRNERQGNERSNDSQPSIEAEQRPPPTPTPRVTWGVAGGDSTRGITTGMSSPPIDEAIVGSSKETEEEPLEEETEEGQYRKWKIGVTESKYIRQATVSTGRRLYQYEQSILARSQRRPTVPSRKGKKPLSTTLFVHGEAENSQEEGTKSTFTSGNERQRKEHLKRRGAA